MIENLQFSLFDSKVKMNKYISSFCLVKFRPWPILAGITALLMIRRIIFIFKFINITFALLIVGIMFIISAIWWRDINRESSYLGIHTNLIQQNLKIRIILFITREVFFFGAFFWSFFHISLNPSIDLGLNWPPMGIVAVRPFHVPLLNTVILLRSGIFVTWRHNNLILRKERKVPLIIGILLGAYFTIIQGIEYYETYYAISDSIYRCLFFILTGFHGIHVLVGTIFLLAQLLRIDVLSATHHTGYELRIWYWHFVDVVWLFLFSFIYWWRF